MTTKRTHEYDQKKADYLRRLATLPRHEQQRHLTVALAWLFKVAIELNPEQVPADDQSTIDAEFRIIMEGTDL